MKRLKKHEDFVNENNNKHDYMMLSRLQQDCEYFLNYGKGNEGRLYYGNVEEHIQAMKDLWNKLPEKPEWLTMEQIEEYENQMLNYDENSPLENDTPNAPKAEPEPVEPSIEEKMIQVGQKVAEQQMDYNGETIDNLPNALAVLFIEHDLDTATVIDFFKEKLGY